MINNCKGIQSAGLVAAQLFLRRGDYPAQLADEVLNLLLPGVRVVCKAFRIQVIPVVKNVGILFISFPGPEGYYPFYTRRKNMSPAGRPKTTPMD